MGHGVDPGWETVSCINQGERHVIAGTVVTIGAPIFDLDSNDLYLPIYEDTGWTYGLYTQNQGTIMGDVSPGVCLWRAPTYECTIGYVMSASNSASQYAVDPDVPNWVTGKIVVHELEVWELRQSGQLAQNGFHPQAPGYPHQRFPSSGNPSYVDVACEGWYSAQEPLPTVRWTADDPDNYPWKYMRFDGQSPAAVGIRLRAKVPWSGDVVETGLRVHAPWPREGVSLDTNVFAVSSLPIGTLTAFSSENLDCTITRDAAHYWDWQYDVNCGTPYELTVDLTPRTVLTWVATSYGPVDEPLQCTVRRVQSVYGGMDGLSQTVPIARKAGEWVRNAVGFDGGQGWASGGYYTGDLWCLVCVGAADCIRGAQLSAEACKLVGVPAYARKAYPQQNWQPDGEAPWTTRRPCWSGMARHWDERVVGFFAGNGFNWFEGYYALGDGEELQLLPFWTWESGGEWCCLPHMITALADMFGCAPPFPLNPANEDPLLLGDPIDGIEPHAPPLHQIPEPWE